MRQIPSITRRLACTALGAAVGLPALAGAEEAVLKEVTVEARRAAKTDTVAKPAPYSPLAIPATASGVQEITAAQIEALRPADVYDLFETSLGLSIRRQGSRVHNWVMDRGNSTSAMGLVIDGVFISQNEATRILGDLPVTAIESVRIVRDASLMTLGPILSGGSSGATNQGFILVTTKRGTRTGSEASLSYGTWNTLNATLFHGEKVSDDVNFGFGYSKSRNDSKVDQSGDWYNRMDGNLFWGNAAWKSRWLIASGTVLYNQVKRDIQRYQEANGTWGTAAWTYDPINTMHAGIDLAFPWSEGNTSQLTAGYSADQGVAYYNTAKAKDYDVDSLVRVAGQSFDDRSLQANLVHTLVLGKNTAKAGVQVIQEMQRTEGSSTSGMTDMLGIYLSDELRPLPTVTLDAGGRMDKLYVVRGSEKYTKDSVTTLTKSHMWTDDAYSAALGALWEPLELASLSGRVAFTSAPTPSTMSTLNNADLPAEKRIKYELGPTLRLSPAFELALTGYWYDIRDAKVAAVNAKGKTITFLTKDKNSITVYDAHDLERKGFEASLKGRLLQWLGYDLGYTWSTSDYKPEDTTMMRYKVTGGVNFRKDGLTASLSMVYVPAYTHNSMPVGDFCVFNANLGKEIREGLVLSVWGRNLTDEKYTTNYKGIGSGYYYDIGAVYGVEAKASF